MSEAKSSGGDGGIGCLLLIILMFVSCNGITVDGRHYSVGCGCGDGCTFTHEVTR